MTFNTAFNISLAYLAFAETSLTLRRAGDTVVVQLTAPLNFDYTKVETATVNLTTASGESEPLTLTEDSSNARTFSARIPLRRGASALVGASYGFGYLSRHTTLSTSSEK